VPNSDAEPQATLAAGAIPVRQRDGRAELVLIHRPRYDDWSFPKGKLDPGEHLLTAAVREVHEECGLQVRLGPPLPPIAYGLSSGVTKLVRYWLATPVNDDVPSPVDTDEVDRAEWVDLDAAPERLTYEYEQQLIGHVSRLVRSGPLVALVLLRHAHAKSRSNWRVEDEIRPLSRQGRTEAAALRPVLATFGLRRLVSSDAVRCRRTLEALAKSTGIELEVDPALAETSDPELTRAAVIAARDDAVSTGRSTLVCSHRPTLPGIFDALGLTAVPLPPAGFVVAHLDQSGTALSQEQFGL
jgi:8-oxo-(d)GTP phosphatase